MASEECVVVHPHCNKDHSDRRLPVLRSRINELENEVNILKLQLESRYL